MRESEGDAFPGLHILSTLGNFYKTDPATKQIFKEAEITEGKARPHPKSARTGW